MMKNWVLRKLYRCTPTQDPTASEQQNWDSNPGLWCQAWTLSALLSSFMWELKCLHWFGVRRQSVPSYSSARATWTMYWLILHVSFFFFFLVLAILLVSCLFSCFTQCATVVVQLLSCIQLCDPMFCSTPGSSALYYLLELAQLHDHWVSDAI